MNKRNKGRDRQPQSSPTATRDPNKDPSPSRPDSEPPIQYSPSGDPGERRDDDSEPSPDGPQGGSRREDSDVEGLHTGGHESVERE